MSDLYDFRIKQSVYVQALEIYKSMETILESEREKQRENAANMKQNWAGISSDAFVEATNNYLDQGGYAQAYSKVVGMRELIEYTLPEINALLARCEGFLEQLQSDSYVEPIRPTAGDNTVRNGDILSLNYDVIGVIKDLCNTVEEENNSLTNTLKSIIADCSSVVDGTDSDLAAVDLASKKLNRIANYHDSFQKYEQGVRNLEFELNLKLCALTEDVEELCEEVGISEAELESGIMDIEDKTNPAYLSEQELEQLMTQYLESGDIDAMQSMAEQIFAQDADEWNNAEVMFIAQTLDYAFEINNLEMIEAYTGNMLMEEYANPRAEYYGKDNTLVRYLSEYQVKPDEQKIQLVMSMLNPVEQGEAYYTLNRISKMQIEGISFNLSGNQIEEYGSFFVDAQIMGGEIQLLFTGQIEEGHTDFLAPMSAEYKMTIYDMGEILSEEKEELFLKLGYSESEIQALRENVVSDSDVVFVDKLTEQSYGELFSIPPQGVNNLLLQELANYIMVLEKNGDTAEIQQMLNGVLETDAYNNRCVNGNSRGRYLDIICAGLLDKLGDANNEILKLESGSAEEKNLINDAEQMYKQYGLWNAINYIYCSELGLDGLIGIEHQYAYGGYRAVISELGEGDGNVYSQYDFKVHFVDSETGEMTLDGQYIYVDLAKLIESDLGEAEDRIEIAQLEKERREIVVHLIVDGIETALEKTFPGISYILPITETLSEGGFTDMLKVQRGFPYEEYISTYEKTTGKKITKDELNLVISAILKEQDLNAQIDRAEDALWNKIYSQGISVDAELRDSQGASLEHNELITGTGILLPQAEKNLSKWETGGIEVVLSEMGMDELEVRKKINIIRDLYPEDEIMELLISGGNIHELNASELSNYILKIEDKLGNKYDISVWLKEGVITSEEK